MRKSIRSAGLEEKEWASLEKEKLEQSRVGADGCEDEASADWVLTGEWRAREAETAGGKGGVRCYAQGWVGFGGQ
jgi:hypothetical protein